MTKKIVLLTMMIVGILSPTFAQRDIFDIYITDYPESISVCRDDNVTFYVHAEDDCNFTFIRNGQPIYTTPLIINTNYGLDFHIDYIGCEVAEHSFDIKYDQSLPNPFTHVTWKDVEETVTLSAVRSDSTDYYHYKWIRGTDTISTNRFIHVDEADGSYRCMIYNACGSIIRNFPVYDRAKITVARVDPTTGQIILEWDPEQSILQNANTIEIYCDDTITNMVGIADITTGIWTDAITQNSAVRSYWCKTVAIDGEKSQSVGPIQTIFATTIPTMNPEKAIALWNIPQGYDEFSWFRLNQVIFDGKDEPEIIPIDSVSASETMIEFNTSLVTGNNKIYIEAVYSNEVKSKGRTAPTSNPMGYDDVVGIPESSEADSQKSWLYPNPTTRNNSVYVKGTGTITIRNVLGQTIFTKTIEGDSSLDLEGIPCGVFIVTLQQRDKSYTVKLIVTQ